jgi:hypothetical protein
MVFKSLFEERNSLKLKIYTLECIKEAKDKQIEYWLAAAKEVLRIIHFEEKEKDHAEKNFLESLEHIVKQVEELKEQKENKLEITELQNQAEALIVKTRDKYRGELAVKDAIISKEPTEFEDKISELIDSYYLKSKFFKIQVWVLLAVIAFAGFGSWQLYSGAKSTGDMVNEMHQRVNDAYKRIDKITGNLEALLTDMAEDKIDKKIDKIATNVEKNVTDKVEGKALKRIDIVFNNQTAEERVAALIKEKVQPHVKKTTIDNKVEAEINKDVTNRVKTLFENIPMEQRAKPLLKGMLESKMNQMDYDAAVKTIAKKDIAERINGLFKKDSVEQQVATIIKNEVESEIRLIDIESNVGSLIKNDVNSKIKELLGTTSFKEKVNDVIDTWLRTSRTQIQSIENRIESVEKRVVQFSRGLKFSILNIWVYADWFLKGSIIFLYLLFLSVIVLGAVNLFLYFKNKFAS